MTRQLSIQHHDTRSASGQKIERRIRLKRAELRLRDKSVPVGSSIVVVRQELVQRDGMPRASFADRIRMTFNSLDASQPAEHARFCDGRP